MNEELDRFEKTLEDGLIKICSMAGLTDEIMMSPDIDGKWDEFIKDYVADAVATTLLTLKIMAAIIHGKPIAIVVKRKHPRVRIIG